MRPYSVDIAWSEEDGGYIATVPEFPDLSAFGETQEEALAQAKDALAGFIEVYEESGFPLPEPRQRTQFSGQLRLRMPKSLHARLSSRASQEGVSLNQFIVSLVSEAYGFRSGKASAGAETFIARYPLGFADSSRTVFSGAARGPEGIPSSLSIWDTSWDSSPQSPASGPLLRGAGSRKDYQVPARA